MERPEIVDRVVGLAGGPKKVGAELGLRSQAISMWRRIPAKYVLQLEAMTEGKFTRHEMRPDIFGPAEKVA